MSYKPHALTLMSRAFSGVIGYVMNLDEFTNTKKREIPLILHLSLRQLVEDLEGIRVGPVQEKTDRKMKMVVEEMDARQANLFSLLNLGKFMGI